MKKILLIVLTTVMTLQVMAQLKPEKGDIGFTFHINGLANLGLQSFETSALTNLSLTSPLANLPQGAIDGLLPQDMLFARYYLEENKVLRIALGAGFIDQTSTSLAGISDYAVAELSTFSGSIGIGFEQHYSSLARRIDPYGGLQANFGYLGAIKGRNETRTSGGATIATVEDVYTLPGGWNAQLNFIGGVNVFITDNLSIGGEFALGAYYTNLTGDWTIEQTISTDTQGQVVTNTDSYTGNVEQSALGFRMGGTTGFNVSFFF